MGVISKMRRQYAVYWAVQGVDAFGKTILSYPIEIRCRWDDINELFVEPISKETIVSSSKVYIDRSVSLGSYLWLGRLDDLPSPSSPPDDVFGAMPVRRLDKNPDFKARETLYTAVL